MQNLCYDDKTKRKMEWSGMKTDGSPLDVSYATVLIGCSPQGASGRHLRFMAPVLGDFVFKWEFKNNLIYSSEHFGACFWLFHGLNRMLLLSFLKSNLVKSHRYPKHQWQIYWENQSLELQAKPLPQSILESTTKFHFQPTKCVWRHQQPKGVTCTRGTLEKASLRTQECSQGREPFKLKRILHSTMGM